MRKVLEKIAWLTRRWNIRVYFGNLYIHDEHDSWGIEILTVAYNHRPHSLISFKFRLPNKTNVKKFVVDEWDFLFLRRPLYLRFDRLSDYKIWGSKLNRIQKIQLYLLEKIFR